MAIDVPMPKLGLTMEEATILDWLVADGELVEADQPIVLIETDKTETEVGAPGSGRLRHVGQVGEVFACGRLIAYLLADGEHPPESMTAPAPTTGSSVVAASTAATLDPVVGAGAVIDSGGCSPSARR